MAKPSMATLPRIGPVLLPICSARPVLRQCTLRLSQTDEDIREFFVADLRIFFIGVVIGPHENDSCAFDDHPIGESNANPDDK